MQVEDRTFNGVMLFERSYLCQRLRIDTLDYPPGCLYIAGTRLGIERQFLRLPTFYEGEMILEKAIDKRQKEYAEGMVNQLVYYYLKWKRLAVHDINSLLSHGSQLFA